ncbi:uncharacterized protein LOC111048412 [Nilaparvata lugens]|uniref:uncharacterized protein LOC111048412 n=1 Tax=Nilaparvata lugens TaxID=108931 RepID=UPI00193CDCA2|nr:uncharacterized protein LOC111048412 [Nilaparvata lugens]
MSNSPSSNENKEGDQTKLRKRIDVIGGKQLSLRTHSNNSRNRPTHNDQLPEMHRTRRLTLSNIQDVGYSRTVKGKLLLQSQDKNIVQIDLTKSNEFPFRCQSQRLCLKRSNESLGSILNPICLSDELKFRKKWPDPHHERPTWESMKWNTPMFNSDDEVKTLMRESSQSVIDYVRSTKELHDILMACGCPKTVEKSLEHQEDSNDVVWVQEDNSFKNRMEPTFLTEEARFVHMELEPQGLLASQQNLDSEGQNCSESDTDSVMIIDLDSQSSKDSNSQTDNALEVNSVLQNERRYSLENLDFVNNQSDMQNPHVPRIEPSAVPINELESNGVSKYYANLFVGESSEGNEYYSSNLVLLKGDENMVATAKVSEGKVVLHCIKSDFGEDQVSWDKDETITLYSDNTNKVEAGSGQSSRSSSSSHSSYSCQHGCCSAPSEKEACSMNSCSLHNMTSTDIDLHLTLEETRKASSELIVSTLVLNSIISGQSQKDIVDKILNES